MKVYVCRFWKKGEKEMTEKMFVNEKVAKALMDDVVTRPFYIEGTGTIDILAPDKYGELVLDDFIEY